MCLDVVARIVKTNTGFDLELEIEDEEGNEEFKSMISWIGNEEKKIVLKKFRDSVF